MIRKNSATCLVFPHFVPDPFSQQNLKESHETRSDQAFRWEYMRLTLVWKTSTFQGFSRVVQVISIYPAVLSCFVRISEDLSQSQGWLN